MIKSGFGKYRGVIISIALFVLLDASVLGLNFYISFQIAGDAVGVNIAGRQRMLSQRMVKALYDINYSLDRPEELTRALNELGDTSVLFDSTLKAFIDGAEVRGADQSQVVLKAVASAPAQIATRQASELWQPYREKLQALLNTSREPQDPLFQQALSAALVYARTENLTLLKLMNDLTVELEQIASTKAARLRTIQSVGITLAIVNFFFIVFHFIAQLRDGDRRIEAARRETSEILATVGEGLFLLDENLNIGHQHSKQMYDIFGQREFGGRSLNDLLVELISAKDLQTTRGFIGLLFNPKIKEKLISDLNPLDQVQVNLPREKGGYVTKYLSFQFARVYEAERIAHVLVTVNDITERMRLAQELEASRSQNEQQLEMLTDILHSDAGMLQQFLDRAYESFNRINAVLRERSRDQADLRRKLQAIFVTLHNFKGEASALRLKTFATQAHDFETELAGLRDNPQLSGNDFLGLTIRLDKLMQYTQSVQRLVEQLGQLVVVDTATATGDPCWQHLHTLASDVAQRQGKEVSLVACGLSEVALHPAQQAMINQLCIQFIRNAVVHGIETPGQRRAVNKPALGRIDVRLSRIGGERIELVIRDDGAGFDYEAIRQRARELNLYSEQQLEALSNRDALALIFQPGFSTQDQPHEDAGRGVGMDLIRARINESQGKLLIASRPGRYCQFTVTLPLLHHTQAAA